MAPFKIVIFFLALTLTIVHAGAASRFRNTTGDPFDAFVPPFSCPGPPPCACTCECQSALPQDFREDRRMHTAGFDISWNSTHVIGSFNFKEGNVWWLGLFVIPSILAPAVFWFVALWIGVRRHFNTPYSLRLVFRIGDLNWPRNRGPA